MENQSAYVIIKETTEAIVNVLLSQFVQLPSETEYKKITTGYLENWNFPNCLGSVDGKHCIIRAPLRDLVVFITTIKKHLV